MVVKSLNELIGMSVEISNGLYIETNWPGANGSFFSVARTLMEAARKHPIDGKKGLWHYNGGVIGFIVEGKYFVTPVSHSKYRFCEENFEDWNFWLPLCGAGEYPGDFADLWNRLRVDSRDADEEENREVFSRYADEHGIKALAADIMAQCFHLPKSGVLVRREDGEEKVFPVFAEVDDIGTYCYNKGTVVFVDRAGETYLAKGDGAIRALEMAGYHCKARKMPIYDGDELVDPVHNCSWSSCKPLWCYSKSGVIVPKAS